MKLNRLLLLLIFIVHALWASHHMLLHHQDKVNPWKGGGYAMYTIPSPQPEAVVLYESNLDEWQQVDPSNLTLFNKQRKHNTYYCKIFTEKDLLVLLSTNPQIIGMNTEIHFVKWVMNKFPITMEQHQYGGVRLFWPDDGVYSYVHQNCDGKIYRGSGSINTNYGR